MVGNTGTVKIQIRVDDKGSVHVKELRGEFDKTGKKGEKAFKRTGKSLESMNKKSMAAKKGMIALGATAAALAVLYMAVKKIVNVMKGWVAAAEIQESAEKRLEAVLRATGHAAGYNLEQLKAMASGMQGATTVGDELILGGMSILATFKKVRGEAFERTSAAALDLATVIGKGKVTSENLQAAMLQLGKVMEDPIANMGALTRSGVSFTAAEKEMVKELWKAGKVMEAQNIILKAVEGQVKGTAAAMRENFGGMKDAASNALGDVREELGFVITKNQFFIDLMGKAEEVFKGWGEKIKENREYLQAFVKEGMEKAITAAKILWEGIKLLYDAFTTLWNIITAIPKGVLEFFENLRDRSQEAADKVKGLGEELSNLEAPRPTEWDKAVEDLDYYGDLILSFLKWILVEIGNTAATGATLLWAMFNPFTSIEEKAKTATLTIQAWFDGAKASHSNYLDEIKIRTAQHNDFEAESVKEKLKILQQGYDEALAKTQISQSEAEEIIKKSIKDVEDATKKQVEESMKAEKKHVDFMKKVNKELVQENATRLQAAFKDQDKYINMTMKARLKYLGMEKKAQKDYTDDIRQATKSLYDDLKEMKGRNYEYELELLQRQAKKYDEAMHQQGASAEWLRYQERELLKDRLVEYGGFFGGIKAGLMQASDDWNNFYQEIGQFGYDTFNGLTSAFSQTFVHVMKFNFREIGNTWQALMDTMLNSFIKLIADMLARGAMLKIGNFVFGDSFSLSSGGGLNLGIIGKIPGLLAKIPGLLGGGVTSEPAAWSMAAQMPGYGAAGIGAGGIPGMGVWGGAGGYPGFAGGQFAAPTPSFGGLGSLLGLGGALGGLGAFAGFMNSMAASRSEENRRKITEMRNLWNVYAPQERAQEIYGGTAGWFQEGFQQMVATGHADWETLNELARIHGETIEMVSERYKTLWENMQYQESHGFYEGLMHYDPGIVRIAQEDFLSKWAESFKEVSGGYDWEHAIQEGFLDSEKIKALFNEASISYVDSMREVLDKLSQAEQDWLQKSLEILTSSDRTVMASTWFDLMKADFAELTNVEQKWVLSHLAGMNDYVEGGTTAARDFYESQIASWDQLTVAEQSWVSEMLQILAGYTEGSTDSAQSIYDEMAGHFDLIGEDFSGTIMEMLSYFSSFSSIIDSWSPASKNIDIYYHHHDLPPGGAGATAQYGAIISGPASGYTIPMTFHCTEEIRPLGSAWPSERVIERKTYNQGPEKVIIPIKIVTRDDKELQAETVEVTLGELKNRSENNEIVIYAGGVG